MVTFITGLAREKTDLPQPNNEHFHIKVHRTYQVNSGN